MAAPFDEYAYAGPARKAIYLLLNFGRPDLPPLVLTDEAARAGGTRVLLRAAGSENGAFALSLSGIVNCETDAGWHDGEVKISLYYHMEAILSPEAEAANAAPAFPTGQNTPVDGAREETQRKDKNTATDEGGS
jgi:hypothetical protein